MTASQAALNPHWHAQLKQDTLEDAQARLAAINPAHSFIVQAPAGSGKTALLTQRFLALLAQVSAPEQIVAMTFTKKAAAEMRERVLSALALGQGASPKGASVYDHNTYVLAKAAFEHSQAQQWQLLDNPNRLRIRTIDSINGFLVEQMPFLSKMGAQAQIEQRPEALYREAVHAVLSDPDLSAQAATLMRLVNGRYARAETQLLKMLAQRDQWMRVLFGAAQRASLEGALQSVVDNRLSHAVSQLGPLLAHGHALPSLAQTALAHQPDKPFQALAQADWPLDATHQALPAWRALAQFLLTKNQTLRSRWTRSEGFPPTEKKQKQVLKDLMDTLKSQLSAEAIAALGDLRTLPEPHYTDQQWQDLSDLIALLKHTLAHLKWVFKKTGRTDFIEMAQAASSALGEESAPTDLALRLDYQLKHLLVDEFQDTSVAQFDLLQKMIRGWQPDEDRSLFLVGDPMQSIYRFREAEVGNFLRVWQGEALSMPITPVQLRVNFRSQPGLVDWFNQVFGPLFPQQDDLTLGAVSYSDASPSQADKGAVDATPNVVYHWQVNAGAQAQAEALAHAVEARLAALRSANQTPSIAVLGRSRSHLVKVAFALKQRGLAFRALDLEALADRQEVQDCLALTRACLHGHDREAWLALLRAPFVGLGLDDLYALLGGSAADRYADVPSVLADQTRWSACSQEGQARLAHAWPVLSHALALLGHQALSRVIHQAWWSLGGAHTLDDPVALDNVHTYFEGLADWDGCAELPTRSALSQWLAELYAQGDVSESAQAVQLMTMHKAKGLQFDSVFLPALAQAPRGDQGRLVNRLTFATAQEEASLLIAPIDPQGQDKSGINHIIDQVGQQKQRLEDLRLFYVAATRAEAQLHLFADFTLSRTDLKNEHLQPKAPAKSLIAPWLAQFSWLNQALAPLVDQAAADLEQASTEPTPDPATLGFQPQVKRLALPALQKQTWLVSGERPVPEMPSAGIDVAPISAQDHEVADEVAHEVARDDWLGTASGSATQVGTLVHALLEQVALEGVSQWPLQRLQRDRAHYRYWLRQAGVAPDALEGALDRVIRSMRHALSNDKVRWALAATGPEAMSEWALSAGFEGVSHHVIDRTFVDDHGVRWILDYKTSRLQTASQAERHEPLGHQDTHTEAQMTAQINAQISDWVAAYRPQLARYGALLAHWEQRPQKWVLYFTELDRWVEVT